MPIEHAVNKLRSLYSVLCKEGDFENFTRLPKGAKIERPPSEETGSAHLIFSGDRVRFMEEGGMLTIDSFSRNLEMILKRTMEELSIPVFLMQQSTVRTLVTPGNFNNAADFIGARLMSRKINEEIVGFQRPAKIFGLRFAFPPTGQHRENYQVRVEVFGRDPKSLYIENIGTFRNPIKQSGLDMASKAVQATGSFVTETLCPFLSTFDVG